MTFLWRDEVCAGGLDWLRPEQPRPELKRLQPSRRQRAGSVHRSRTLMVEEVIKCRLLQRTRTFCHQHWTLSWQGWATMRSSLRCLPLALAPGKRSQALPSRTTSTSQTLSGKRIPLTSWSSKPWMIRKSSGTFFRVKPNLYLLLQYRPQCSPRAGQPPAVTAHPLPASVPASQPNLVLPINPMGWLPCLTWTVWDLRAEQVSTQMNDRVTSAPCRFLSSLTLVTQSQWGTEHFLFLFLFPGRISPTAARRLYPGTKSLLSLKHQIIPRAVHQSRWAWPFTFVYVYQCRFTSFARENPKTCSCSRTRSTQAQGLLGYPVVEPCSAWPPVSGSVWRPLWAWATLMKGSYGPCSDKGRMWSRCVPFPVRHENEMKWKRIYHHNTAWLKKRLFLFTTSYIFKWKLQPRMIINIL